MERAQTVYMANIPELQKYDYYLKLYANGGTMATWQVAPDVYYLADRALSQKEKQLHEEAFREVQRIIQQWPQYYDRYSAIEAVVKAKGGLGLTPAEDVEAKTAYDITNDYALTQESGLQLDKPVSERGIYQQLVYRYALMYPEARKAMDQIVEWATIRRREIADELAEKVDALPKLGPSGTVLLDELQEAEPVLGPTGTLVDLEQVTATVQAERAQLERQYTAALQHEKKRATEQAKAEANLRAKIALSQVSLEASTATEALKAEVLTARQQHANYEATVQTQFASMQERENLLIQEIQKREQALVAASQQAADIQLEGSATAEQLKQALLEARQQHLDYAAQMKLHFDSTAIREGELIREIQQREHALKKATGALKSMEKRAQALIDAERKRVEALLFEQKHDKYEAEQNVSALAAVNQKLESALKDETADHRNQAALFRQEIQARQMEYEEKLGNLGLMHALQLQKQKAELDRVVEQAHAMAAEIAQFQAAAQRYIAYGVARLICANRTAAAAAATPEPMSLFEPTVPAGESPAVAPGSIFAAPIDGGRRAPQEGAALNWNTIGPIAGMGAPDSIPADWALRPGLKFELPQAGKRKAYSKILGTIAGVGDAEYQSALNELRRAGARSPAPKKARKTSSKSRSPARPRCAAPRSKSSCRCPCRERSHHPRTCHAACQTRHAGCLCGCSCEVKNVRATVKKGTGCVGKTPVVHVEEDVCLPPKKRTSCAKPKKKACKKKATKRKSKPRCKCCNYVVCRCRKQNGQFTKCK